MHRQRVWAAEDAAYLTGVSKKNIENWRARGHFMPRERRRDPELPGWVRYDFIDLITLAMLKRLTGTGIIIEFAKKMAAAAIETFLHHRDRGGKGEVVIAAAWQEKGAVQVETMISSETQIVPNLLNFARRGIDRLAVPLPVEEIRKQLLRRIDELDKADR